MTDFTAKQSEALRLLEKYDGNLYDAAREAGNRPNGFKRRISDILDKSGLDPLIPAQRAKLLRIAEEQRAKVNAAETKKRETRCFRPCVYRAGGNSVNSCDYMYITGKMRGCPLGEACTKFEEGERRNPVTDECAIPLLRTTGGLEEIQLYAKAQRRMREDYRAKNHL